MSDELPDVVNDFEAWAAVSASLQGCSDGDCEALIDELGIGEVWDRADAAWSKALAAELLDMKLDRIARYAEICARVLSSRRGDFRHRATYGLSAKRRRPSPVGGTPFSADPDDRTDTRQMSLDDARRLDEGAEQNTRKLRPEED